MEHQACKNCDFPVSGSFCSNCGQKVITQRLTIKNLLHQTVEMITNLEKGFWYTTLMVFKNPGQVAREYISGATIRYFNPFRFLLIWMSVTAFINLSTNLLEKAVAASNDFFGKTGEQALQISPEMLENANRMMEYMPLFALVFIPFLALMSFWMFKKEGYNYAEHIIAMIYFYTAFSILNLAWFVLYLAYPTAILFNQAFSSVVAIVYLILAYRSWFQLTVGSAIWRGLAVFIGGNGMYAVVALIGTLIYKAIMSIIN